MRVSPRLRAAMRARRPRSQRRLTTTTSRSRASPAASASIWIPAFAGMTGGRDASDKSPFPLWEGARARASRAGRSRAYLSEAGLAGFSGFRFAQIAILAITGNPVKTNMDGRLPIKDEPVESYNPENPDSDRGNAGGRPRSQPLQPTASTPLWIPAFAGMTGGRAGNGGGEEIGNEWEEIGVDGAAIIHFSLTSTPQPLATNY